MQSLELTELFLSIIKRLSYLIEMTYVRTDGPSLNIKNFVFKNHYLSKILNNNKIYNFKCNTKSNVLLKSKRQNQRNSFNYIVTKGHKNTHKIR